MSYDSYETLKVSIEAPIARILIDRPPVNPLSSKVISELTSVAHELELSDDVQVIILSGAGEKAFVAGADIKEMLELSPQDARAFAEMGGMLGETLETSTKTWIAAVNGIAFGGGCELALACDFIHASEKAKFGQPEVKLGVIPGFGGTQRLLRLSGRAAALELCLLGDNIDAARALQLNLVTRVVPKEELEAETRKLAGKLAKAAPQALRGMLDAIVVAGEAPLEAALEFETQAFAVTFSTEDMREGTSAFLARRPATFTGR